jgi:hypothetical protein
MTSIMVLVMVPAVVVVMMVPVVVVVVVVLVNVVLVLGLPVGGSWEGDGWQVGGSCEAVHIKGMERGSIANFISG